MSSETGFGIDQLKQSIYKALLENEPRSLRGKEELILAERLGHNLTMFDMVIISIDLMLKVYMIPFSGLVFRI